MEDDAAAGLVGGLLALFTGGFLLVMLACAVIMIASMWTSPRLDNPAGPRLSLCTI